MFGRFISLLFSIALATLLPATTADEPARVHPDVHRTLLMKGSANIIVTLAGSTDTVLGALSSGMSLAGSSMTSTVKDQLVAHNTAAAAPTIAMLTQQTTSINTQFTLFENFWISNQVYIQDASPVLVQLLSVMTSVIQVRNEIIVNIQPDGADLMSQDIAAAVSTSAAVEWGVTKIKAPHVWNKGSTGQGILVGTIDTGVRSTHEALATNFGGNYSWFDAEKKLPTPYDSHGHGTHALATIAGVTGVGVAPGATWMTCKGCRGGSCPESDLLACGQFILCPTDTSGNNPDCTKAPRIVSNSWGFGQGSTWYSAVVNAWVKAGIIPIFAIGNSGPGCTTAQSPGDYSNVIGVGSSASSDSLSGFSSKGPSILGALKPDIVAPGSSVRSAWNSSDTAYATVTGTSAAAPHVAGALALLLSVKPQLTVESAKALIFQSTDHVGLGLTNYTCNMTSDATWPNNQWGNGRLNVFKAYQSI